MRIDVRQDMSHPLEKVYTTMRDDLPGIAAFLSGVESIETTEREEFGPGRVRLLNVWQANKENVPKVVRSFVTSNMLRWKDHAEWNDEDHSVRWRFETFQFDKLFECSGGNRFEELPAGGTRMNIQGDLQIFPERIPGVPRFLARRIKPKIEEFIMKMVGSNLSDLARGLQEFLDQHGGGP
jgi:hypothetical protein